MGTSDEDEDQHFCLRCHATIEGLENYVAHRKAGRCRARPEEDALKADDFFSSLNLQSSSKGTAATALVDLSWGDPPPGHTGGKWRPQPAQQQERNREEGEEVSYGNSSGPPPEHTRGKWGPQERQWLGGSGSLYWCGPCNRRLSSRLMYDRHLKTEYHFKKTHQERQLEGEPRPIRNTRSQRLTVLRKQDLSERERRVGGKRKRGGGILCEVCQCKVSSHQLGKHLVSHYHCRHPRSESSHRIVVENMESIVKQAPFQCQLCKFYCNTMKTFVAHWTSDLHRQNDSKLDGRYWCSFCKYGTESSLTMGCHLMGESHREVLTVINHSVPIVIQKRIPLLCEVCQKPFRYNAELRRHAQAWDHPQEKSTASDKYQQVYGCAHCPGYRTHKLQGFQMHMRLQHKELEGHYFCRVCDLRFATAEEAKSHRLNSAHRTAQRDRDGRSCPHCTRVFETTSDMKQHILSQHPEFLSRCIKCGKKFTLKQELSQHVKSKSCKAEKGSGEGGKCDKCGFPGDSEADLLLHGILEHDEPVGEGPEARYRCPACDKLYSKNSLRKHVRIHATDQTFICSICDMSFSRKDALGKHMTVHTAGKKEEREGRRCEECGAHLESLADLRRHLAEEHPGRLKQHTCTHCGQGFFDKSRLNQHMQRHLGKKFHCKEEECIFSCRSQAELATHMRTHFQARDFHCPHCLYASKTKSQLAKHIKFQHEEGGGQYVCPHCSFTTRNCSHLNRHLRLHSGAKPYSCPHCPYTCNLLENLRKHVINSKKHPGLFLYPCKVDGCKYSTNFAKEMKTHLVKEHKEDPSVAASYVTGLYQPLEDIKETNNPLPLKPRKRKREKSECVIEGAGELLEECYDLGEGLELNPTLASVALTPSKIHPSTEPTDDVVFIQVQGEELDEEGGVGYLAGDSLLVSAEDHRRILGFEALRNRGVGFTLMPSEEVYDKPSTSYELEAPSTPEHQTNEHLSST